MTPNYIHRIWIFFCFVLSYQILLNFWLEKLTAYFNFALTVKKDTQNSCKNQLSIFHYMQKHDQFTAYFSQKSWKLQFTAQNCERRKKMPTGKGFEHSSNCIHTTSINNSDGVQRVQCAI